MKFLMLIISVFFAFSSIRGYAYEVNHYMINVTPGYEVWEYIDDCNKSHKLSIKTDTSDKQAIMEWFDKIVKITKENGC